EEGAGEMNTLAAVEAARSVADANGTPTPTGNGLLVSPNQATVVGAAGSTASDPVFKVTNAGASSQKIDAHLRQIASEVTNRTTQVSLGPTSPTFVDQFGASRPYATTTFNVPSGVDRLV